jgi:hypothetical protein
MYWTRLGWIKKRRITTLETALPLTCCMPPGLPTLLQNQKPIDKIASINGISANIKSF